MGVQSEAGVRQAGRCSADNDPPTKRMSSRYISHRYGEREEVRSSRESRATSRATSRAPSIAPSLAGSRASSVLDLSSIQPRATSQAPCALQSGLRPKRWSSAMEYSNQRQEFSTSSGLPPMPRSRPSRSLRPLSSSYSDALIKSSQRLRERSSTPPPPPPILDIKPTPFKTNIDYYRGKTKSIYEKEPIFRDFARNIPLSQSLDDSSNLHELKRDFQKLVSARDPALGRPDPLKPSAGQNRLYQPKSEMLSQRHKSQAPAPVILPYIYVYHRDTSRST